MGPISRRRFAAIGAVTVGLVGSALGIGIATTNNSDGRTARGHGSCVAHPERPVCATTTSGGATTAPTTSSTTTATTAPTTTTTSPGGARAIPNPIFGITFDNADGISTTKLNQQKASISGMPHMPMTRIVFDQNRPPGGYTNAINGLQPISIIMGELLDSFYINKVLPPAYEQRARDYLAAFPSKVDVWEVGNEVNGNWTGTSNGEYASVIDKVTRAFHVFDAAGKKTSLTLWENTFGTNHCGNGQNEWTPQQFADALPADVKAGLDLVTVSWYPEQCTGKPNGNSNNIAAAAITAEMVSIHSSFQNAVIGFGELGVKTPANTPAKITTECGLINYYYRLGNLGLPYYRGGYFHWYAAENLVPTTQPLYPIFVKAITPVAADPCP